MDLDHEDIVEKLMFPGGPNRTPEIKKGTLLWMEERIVNSTKPVFRIPSLLFEFEGSDTYLLYFHGNGENLGHNQHYCAYMSQTLKLNVFAVEYPGYGLADGKATERSCIRASMLAYWYLTEHLSVCPSNIYIFGFSIGTGLAVNLAHYAFNGSDNQNTQNAINNKEDSETGTKDSKYKKPIKGLILQSPFTSIKDLAKLKAGPVLSLLIKQKFNNMEKISKIGCPLLIIHGRNDSVIPFTQGVNLYDACVGENNMLYLCNADHNNFNIDKDILCQIKKFMYKIDTNKIT